MPACLLCNPTAIVHEIHALPPSQGLDGSVDFETKCLTCMCPGCCLLAAGEPPASHSGAPIGVVGRPQRRGPAAAGPGLVPSQMHLQVRPLRAVPTGACAYPAGDAVAGRVLPRGLEMQVRQPPLHALARSPRQGSGSHPPDRPSVRPHHNDSDSAACFEISMREYT